MERRFVSNPLGRFIWKAFDAVPFFDYFAIFMQTRAQRRRILTYLSNPSMQIHPTAALGDVWLRGNIEIGEGTYFNEGQVSSGPDSCVRIGKFCAMGYNVHIKAETHDLNQPTALDADTPLKVVEASINIGDHVWVGDNVFIRQGVTIGDHVIIGANSVVLKDIPAYAVAAGAPARVVRMQSKEPNA
jgi:maltose O-acetyltransferase